MSLYTGAAQADCALLVVNATNGEFETGFDLGGQTREHTLLIRSLGMTCGFFQYLDIGTNFENEDSDCWSQHGNSFETAVASIKSL